MGGTLRKFFEAGARIRLVMFSDGAEGYGTPGDKGLIIQRRQLETETVCRILGIEQYYNLHGLDWSLSVNNATYRQVIHHIRSFKPDVVFTHAPTDYNDHQSVSKVTTEGWFHAALPCAMETEKVWHLVPLYEFEVIKSMLQPTHVVDITDTFDAKMKAMESYNSQKGIVGSIFQLMKGRAMERGYLIGVKYGEAFIRSNYQPRGIKCVETLLEKS